MTVLVRTPYDPARIAPVLRREMTAIDPDLSAANIRALDDVVAASVGSAGFSTMIVATFAAAALILSAIGVYGVLAFGVSRRRREIGVRVALGAQRRDVVRLFMRQTLIDVGIGVACGALAALVVTRLMTALLFGVTPTDPASFAGAAALLVGVAGLAGYVPVRAAMRTDPADAIRNR
jgi:putative ABC transport system permease protein